MGEIVLWCPDCGREVSVSRVEMDPPSAVRARLQCDRCDDGDFHSPDYTDADGRWVDPVAYLSQDTAS